MYTVAEVYETDIGLVHVGQQARVMSPALPQALHGTVELIGKTISKNRCSMLILLRRLTAVLWRSKFILIPTIWQHRWSIYRWMLPSTSMIADPIPVWYASR